MKRMLIGQNCYITLGDGAHIISKICGVTEKGYFVLDSSGNTFSVPIRLEDCEEIAIDVFPIGTKVKTEFPGSNGFEGKVVAYEEDTNRLICISNRVKNYSDKRVRYAYRVDELRELDDSFTFKVGRSYEVNGNTILTSVEHPCRNDFVILIDSSSFVVCVVPTVASLEVLEAHQVYSVQELTPKKNKKHGR